METSKLRKFSAYARKTLLSQVEARMQVVLAEGSLARRENPQAITQLETEIRQHGERSVVETAAYTWFNRFCALRYMDVNRYTRLGVVSPAEGQFQPEILLDAKMGHVDEAMIPTATREKVLKLLSKSDPSSDPQGEAYRLLLASACNHFHTLMPFLFEKIADYTELLLPDDLLSSNSVLAHTREALIPANCSPEHTEESVEVIGWLYQFYISEKKDEVFAALKKGKKITPENIPAATQLFTPHWIVRYLVENSLGRLWMLNHPGSKLVERMEYYIRPEEPETDYLRIASPEEIKVCDPACGSGHMLTYAFDLLYAIYEEQGYQATDIPRLILQNNLYGVEIDQRAGALAAFALTMKARENSKRFLTPDKVVQPNICVLENIHLEPEELSAYMDKVGRDLLTPDLVGVVNQWEEADNFGSLIRPLVTDVGGVLELLRERRLGEDMFLAGVHQKVLRALWQADFLSPKYHVVVANPPYMGSKGMNLSLKQWTANIFPESKTDLYTLFISRNCQLAKAGGLVAMITMHSWMFLSTFERLRRHLLENMTILTLAHLGERAFDTIGGGVVSTAAFILKQRPSKVRGCFIRLIEGESESQKSHALLEAVANQDSCGWWYRADTEVFFRIPGSPIAYWLGRSMLDLFAESKRMGEVVDSKVGLQTSDNNRFLRRWFEVSHNDIGFGFATSDEAEKSNLKWFPLNKGGEFRRWYGNHEYVVLWQKDGAEIRQFVTDRYPYLNGNVDYVIKDRGRFFNESVSWSDVTSGANAFRYYPQGFIYDATGHSVFASSEDQTFVLAFGNTKVCTILANVLNPTLHFHIGYFDQLPWPGKVGRSSATRIATEAIRIARADWDASEESWGFKMHCLLVIAEDDSIASSVAKLQQHMRQQTHELQGLETENNDLVISAYALGEEIDNSVSLDEVTLRCNPHYRYGKDKGEAELEALLLADTMREFISYAVGCMLGRYSLDKPGLILANQGETLADYLRQVPEPTFAPDKDNVIPLLDGDWFGDDISEHFKKFLKVTFGDVHYDENLTFLEDSLYPDNVTARKRKTIRDYFLKEFYDHHVKLYRKRPIYWLFSSPKGTFNALIYMHRYRPDTVSVVLNDYLREFQTKLRAKLDHLQAVADSGDTSASGKTKALKAVTELKKQLKELEDYERDVLFPLASEQVTIDLDDGVKVNYNKFGKALKKVVGLSE